MGSISKNKKGHELVIYEMIQFVLSQNKKEVFVYIQAGNYMDNICKEELHELINELQEIHDQMVD